MQDYNYSHPLRIEKIEEGEGGGGGCTQANKTKIKKKKKEKKSYNHLRSKERKIQLNTQHRKFFLDEEL